MGEYIFTLAIQLGVRCWWFMIICGAFVVPRTQMNGWLWRIAHRKRSETFINILHVCSSVQLTNQSTIFEWLHVVSECDLNDQVSFPRVCCHALLSFCIFTPSACFQMSAALCAPSYSESIPTKSCAIWQFNSCNFFSCNEKSAVKYERLNVSQWPKTTITGIYDIVVMFTRTLPLT